MNEDALIVELAKERIKKSFKKIIEINEELKDLREEKRSLRKLKRGLINYE